MSRHDIISQSSKHLGKLAEYGAPALDRLVQQRRVFNRMDWWSPYDWLASDAFCAASASRGVEAALLVIPVSYGDKSLGSALSHVAWVRWCAVLDNLPASGVLRLLIQYSEGELTRAGIDSMFVIVEPVHWFNPYLQEAHFQVVDDVVTMVCRTPAISRRLTRVPENVLIRPAIRYDMDDVANVDRSAFEEQWQYPLFVLRQALETCTYFTVAMHQDQAIGYQFATSDGLDAHITRLAVHPDWQNRGVGAALMADALDYLSRDVRVRFVTLNTQASNEASQRLYKHFGFQLVHPNMHVWCKRLGD